MINAFDIKVAPERLQCPLMTLSLCTVLVAHVGGGVLVDAVVGEVGEHIPNFGALVAVFVGGEPGDWRLLDRLEVSIPTT